MSFLPPTRLYAKKDPVANEDGLAVVDEAVIVAKAPEDLGVDDASKAELVLCPSAEKTNRASFVFVIH